MMPMPNADQSLHRKANTNKPTRREGEDIQISTKTANVGLPLNAR